MINAGVSGYTSFQSRKYLELRGLELKPDLVLFYHEQNDFLKAEFSDRELYDEARVEERYGLPPLELIELKGLVGDTSDNIPGVKGVGEKGGVKLLKEYGTLEGIYEHL